MGDWLHRLHTLIGDETPVPLVPIGANRGQNSISAPNGTIGTGISGQFSPPYDAEGVPCGVCPTCHRGEFWRRPKFHKDHDPRGWVCWFCSPPREDPYTCDFCGVPEENERIK
jgi:hypothetical protein